MREHDLVGVHQRCRRSLTKQDVQAAPAPDLLGRDFTAQAPGEKLVGDITYLPTEEGWLYLATVVDLATRGTRWPTTCAPSWSATRFATPPAAAP